MAATAAPPRSSFTYPTQTSPDGMTTPQEPLADFLGFFSLALGFAEAAAPRSLAELIGVDTDPTLMRMLGLREIASGLGILTHRRPASWLWSRVAGDAMDLTLLGTALARADSGRRGRILAATLAVAGVTALDILCARRHSRDAA